MNSLLKLLSISLFSALLFGGCSIFQQEDSSPNRQRVGSSGRAFLSSERFTSLIVEIDYSEGFALNDTTIANLQAFLERLLDKPGGVTINLDDEIPDDPAFTSRLSRDEVVEMENTYRDFFTEGNTLAAYVFVTDGIFEDNRNTLGFAYFNTSIVLFGGRINQGSNSSGRIRQSFLETSVINHEFGHLLGLVNNGTPMIVDHEDTGNGAHCNVEGCLMQAFIPTQDIPADTTDGMIRVLDPFCRQDLVANGGRQ